MRMRKKSNVVPRMRDCADVLINDPSALHGRWLEEFPHRSRLWLEIGCGKGRFATLTAPEHPEALFVALEKMPSAMVLAMERVCAAKTQNIRFIDADAQTLPVIFAENELDRIYINFCDPWPKACNAKRRLTAPGFLQIYEILLKPEGCVFFKTDNNDLFDYSVESFLAEGWTLSELTRDLHGDGIADIMTDYEQKFHERGIKINRFVARKGT